MHHDSLIVGNNQWRPNLLVIDCPIIHWLLIDFIDVIDWVRLLLSKVIFLPLNRCPGSRQLAGPLLQYDHLFQVYLWHHEGFFQLFAFIQRSISSCLVHTRQDTALCRSPKRMWSSPRPFNKQGHSIGWYLGSARIWKDVIGYKRSTSLTRNEDSCIFYFPSWNEK